MASTVVTRKGQPAAAWVTDVYCPVSSGGCGAIFWPPKNQFYEDWDARAQVAKCPTTKCPECSKVLQFLPGTINFLPQPKIAEFKVAAKEENPKKEEGAGGKKEVDVCCICSERPANTVVQPCGHSSVCVECSEGLKHTSVARTCVKCNQAITSVAVVVSGN